MVQKRAQTIDNLTLKNEYETQALNHQDTKQLNP